MISIETPRLFLREINEDDLPHLLAIYTQKENMRYVSNGKYNWTLEELREKYNRINKEYCEQIGIFVVVLKENGTLIGEGGLFNSFDDNSILELGYIIDTVYWNQGFGSEICRGLIHYSFNRLKTRKVVARMYADNLASVRLCEKMGMTKVESGQTEEGHIYYRYELSTL
ncbi:GNAT family N-acetyltransferase [Parabacteroides sp. PF5-9]|uniref:GNAT family N-acetyltransferase n=1 Tax=Parabacteroides sp. PF5-9 TaxID=1742404 RepID=UPI0024733DD7|nr:GNAT family N-acetyltransferase [Parabacteroides sp. PF5-9]MDH6357108.1 ribosomal-protein-alanine N-acetyltransferase [Parabacteroides sp. PF5-9]